MLVLESAGYRVTIFSRPLCCGRPLYDYGMLSLTERHLRSVISALQPMLRAGVPLVALEPSCAAVFRDELTNLLPNDPDAQRLQRQTKVLAELLQQTDWQLPRLERDALVQPHCHQHSVIGFDSEQEILEQMGMRLQRPDAGCCGMAGSFGYEAGERYEVSMAAGERVLLPTIRDLPPDTLVLADGFSCRSQISAATDRGGLHLAQVLALAIRNGPLG